MDGVVRACLCHPDITAQELNVLSASHVMHFSLLTNLSSITTKHQAALTDIQMQQTSIHGVDILISPRKVHQKRFFMHGKTLKRCLTEGVVKERQEERQILVYPQQEQEKALILNPLLYSQC